MAKALVTGAAGFIGHFVADRLTNEGFDVVGVDNMSTYYDVSLKEARLDRIANTKFTMVREAVETHGMLRDLFEEHHPEFVFHFAAQAGVRHSIDAPRDYLDANLCGTFELLEAARAQPPKHMLLASTSSAYGANVQMPYRETMRTDHQMSFYAATKKATEMMAHSYAHLYDLPVTMFRFFTVYGPWGRPDMALFKFTKAILEGRSIDVYNHGKMRRDFTYVDDLVDCLLALKDVVPNMSAGAEDSLSPVAPWRVLNIGNGHPVELMEYISALETSLGKKAQKNMVPMQAGDVPATWANTDLLSALIGKRPQTDVKRGVQRFVEWYRDFYQA